MSDMRKFEPPKELMDEFKKMFGGDIKVIDMSKAERAEFSEHPELIPVKPLTLKFAKWLLDGEWAPRAGDIVQLRDDGPAHNYMKWPVSGETCVITRVLQHEELAHREGDAVGTSLCTIMLGFIHNCGADDCPMEATIVEYAYDHRYFRRVGNIYDVTPPAIQRPLIPGMGS